MLPVLLLLAICAPTTLRAQFTVRSWLRWRTVETEHFALHYPSELEAWTRDLATRIEAIDSAVTRLVGYTPRGKTDVIVDDPYEIANGSAWPYVDRPIINLWATPPDPRDDIGEFHRWNDMVASHELAHIAHLTRPSRNLLMRRLWQALPVDLGPVAIRAPRWAIEGFATFVEGRVTGSGRPQGTWRPAFLRQWALEGQLPRYDQLNALGGYEGGAFAYLAGSAFLEWLVEKKGDSSLVHVWRRLSARQHRTFDEAFVGVFGESPRALYGRFSAELTSSALAVEGSVRASASADSGAIVQRTAWSTGDPAISADGQRIAIVLRSATMPSRVVIWKTAPEPDTGRARRDSLLRKRDPEDVPARPLYPPPKKAIATLRAPGGSPYESPRFLRDGRVLLWRRVSRGEGSLTSDLYVWDPARKRVRRLTHDASLREADPSPDGRSAVAMQCRSGWCDIVAVDLASGATRLVLRGSPARSFYKPRLSPDGRTGVASVSLDGRWRLVVFQVSRAVDSLQVVGPKDGANRYDASFISADTILTVSDLGGIANLERIDIASGATRALTHVTGAAVAPAYNAADRSVWFLSLYSRGYDVRRIEPAAQASIPVLSLDGRLTPAVPAAQRPAARFAANPVSEPRPFRLQPRLFRWIPQPQIDADGASVALGLVSTDLIGRSELLLTGAIGNPSASRGAAAALTWRGMPVALRLSAFTAQQRPSASRARIVTSPFLDVRMDGAEITLDETRQHDTWSVRSRIGASASSLRPVGAVSAGAVPAATRRLLAFADWLGSRTWRGNVSSIAVTAGATHAMGKSFDASFRRTTATAAFTARAIGFPTLSATGLTGVVNDDASPFEGFSIGGGASPLFDRSLLSQRIYMPALPLGTATGRYVLAYRVALGVQDLSAYFWSGSTSTTNDLIDQRHRVIGAEWSQSLGAIPIAGTPSARAQIGIGRSFDEPFREKTRAYISFVLNP